MKYIRTVGFTMMSKCCCEMTRTGRTYALHRSVRLGGLQSVLSHRSHLPSGRRLRWRLYNWTLHTSPLHRSCTSGAARTGCKAQRQNFFGLELTKLLYNFYVPKTWCDRGDPFLSIWENTRLWFRSRVPSTTTGTSKDLFSRIDVEGRVSQPV